MLYNPKADCLFWLRNCLSYKKVLEARCESVDFIFGITGLLLDTVDGMLEWFDDHKGMMDAATEGFEKQFNMFNDVVNKNPMFKFSRIIFIIVFVIIILVFAFVIGNIITNF